MDAEVNHIAFSTTVPFNRFRVNVSLVHNGIEGPVRMDSGDYGKILKGL